MTTKEITVSTAKKKQVLDITDEVKGILTKTNSQEGVCTIFITHTTAGLTTADLDPGTDLDFLDFLEKIKPSMNYRHPHNPGHAPDHIMSSIIGASVSVPFADGRLILGTWQRIVLVELDGPRERNIIVSITP
jgi:secondary thiamine-phosphate synthase enzyme